MENNKDKIPKMIVPTLGANREQYKYTDKTDDKVLDKNFKKSAPKKKIKEIEIPADALVFNVYKNSKVYIDNTTQISSTGVLQFERILEIDKDYPNAILGFSPPLYPKFIYPNRSINSHVKIGDTVKLAFKFKKHDKAVGKVKELYFKALNDMTVIIAKLENDEFYVSYQLEKV